MKKITKKTDWKVMDMPKKVEKFTLDNDLSETEFNELKFGHIPEEMEDKWFSYFEDNKLYIHRSWSGLCIFIVEFLNNELLVHVNRDKKQYKGNDIEEEKKLLKALLHGLLRR